MVAFCMDVFGFVSWLLVWVMFTTVRVQCNVQEIDYFLIRLNGDSESLALEQFADLFLVCSITRGVA